MQNTTTTSNLLEFIKKAAESWSKIIDINDLIYHDEVILDIAKVYVKSTPSIAEQYNINMETVIDDSNFLYN